MSKKTHKGILTIEIIDTGVGIGKIINRFYIYYRERKYKQIIPPFLLGL
jgi:hypothetical protein